MKKSLVKYVGTVLRQVSDTDNAVEFVVLNRGVDCAWKKINEPCGIRSRDTLYSTDYETRELDNLIGLIVRIGGRCLGASQQHDRLVELSQTLLLQAPARLLRHPAVSRSYPALSHNLHA